MDAVDVDSGEDVPLAAVVSVGATAMAPLAWVTVGLPVWATGAEPAPDTTVSLPGLFDDPVSSEALVDVPAPLGLAAAFFFLVIAEPLALPVRALPATPVLSPAGVMLVLLLLVRRAAGAPPDRKTGRPPARAFRATGRP